ncbi:MAG TPA: phosphopantetheine-binding protein [Candidatus Methylomirabilis sp.]|nr:phosphopantetheine-binding protein [Candidatus Methylomirabilis sp.]
MTTTLETVREILVRKYSLPIERIQPEATLESLNLDSLDLVETLFEVEDEFHIRVPQDGSVDLKIATVQDIVDVVNRLVAMQKPLQLAGGH